MAAVVAILTGVSALGGNRIIRWYRRHAEADRVLELRTITTEVVDKALEPVVAQSHALTKEIGEHTDLDRQGFAQATAADLAIKDEILARFTAFAEDSARDRIVMHGRLDDLEEKV